MPTTSHTDIVVPSGFCQPGSANCRIGFLYWTSLHGPFWQKSPGTTPITDPSYRGSFARIETDATGIFQAHILSDSTGYALSAAPGGSFEGIGYDEFKTSPPVVTSCAAQYYAIADIDGSHTSLSTVLGPANQYFETLTGLIGYVAQNTTNRFDVLRVQSSSTTFLSETHVNPVPPLLAGPMQAESIAGRCSNWAPPYVPTARNVYSQDDVLLVASPASKTVRCFITGISGNWSRTQDGGTDEPYAQIYKNLAGDYRLRVSPNTLAPLQNRVGAYASCVQL